MNGHRAEIGARYIHGKGVKFVVWSPHADSLNVKIISDAQMSIELNKDFSGYFYGTIEGIAPGTRYMYEFKDGSAYPDPASRFQPDGVHGPSEVIDTDAFKWQADSWRGIDLEDYIIYELHIGTFTPEGTFDAVIPRLKYLKELGITAIELMPAAQFPGGRNWGYDCVNPYAPQNTYGGPEGLMRLVDACHLNGISVILDVVYNHLGPEGNYLCKFGPYFTGRYKTPWGDALNFDGPLSDAVRQFFVNNALYWITDYRIDALRLDAVHGIMDFSAKHILQEIADSLHRFASDTGRNIYVIAESDLNDVRLISDTDAGGYGLDAQWNDDFHHSLHALITRETNGYYKDFGSIGDIVKSLDEGFVYSGQYSSYRQKKHGSSSKHISARKFIVFSQNHDQIGNRAFGDKLAKSLSAKQLKLIAGIMLLSPYIPLLFMGEEYAETAPFLYFISHGDPALIDSVRDGRRREFPEFFMHAAMPDPQSETAFKNSKINLDKHSEGTNSEIYEFYKTLLRLRKQSHALRSLSKDYTEVQGFEPEKAVYMRRWAGDEDFFCVFSFNDISCDIMPCIPKGAWRMVIDNAGLNAPQHPVDITSDGTPASYKIDAWGFVLYRKSVGRAA